MGFRWEDRGGGGGEGCWVAFFGCWTYCEKQVVHQLPVFLNYSMTSQVTDLYHFSPVVLGYHK